jgi:predicted ribosome quality control (RQC) complex YloA/Tae2 family protein
VFVLTTQREVWVGRGARDNDELTFRHAAPLDLWFHAGGVEGSHVVLRHLGQDPSPAEQEAAAQLAALFSKAKGSTTVPVWMTRRRYVRKPRKAPPGTVAPERVSTLFVEPAEPAGHWRQRES